MGTVDSLDLGDPRVYTLVRQIFFSKFAWRLRKQGVNVDDGFQEICLGLIRRQQGMSRWNPSRGALSTYVYVATNGLLINYLDSCQRAGRRFGKLGRIVDVAVGEDVLEASLRPSSCYSETA